MADVPNLQTPYVKNDFKRGKAHMFVQLRMMVDLSQTKTNFCTFKRIPIENFVFYTNAEICYEFLSNERALFIFSLL